MHRTKHISRRVSSTSRHSGKPDSSIAGQGTKITGLTNLAPYKAKQERLESMWFSGKTFAGSEGQESFRPFPPPVVINDALVWMYEASIDVTVFADLPGGAGDFFDTPDSVANSIRQHATFECDIALDDFGGGSQVFLGKYGNAANRSYYADFASGLIRLSIIADGTTEVIIGSIPHGFANFTRNSVKIEFNPITQQVTFYTAAHGETLSILGTPLTLAQSEIFDSTLNLYIGSLGGGGSGLMTGKVYSSSITKGIDGVTFDPYMRFDGTEAAAPCSVSTPDSVVGKPLGRVSSTLANLRYISSPMIYGLLY